MSRAMVLLAGCVVLALPAGAQLEGVSGPHSFIHTVTILPDDHTVLVGASTSYRSFDGGFTWLSAGRTNAPLSVRCYASNGTTVFAGAAIDGGVYRSDDNGSSWALKVSLRSTVMDIVASGDLVVAGTADSGVYRSTDLGETWSRSATGLSADIVVSLAMLGDRLFAGTEDGIWVSTDSGGSWRHSGLDSSAVLEIVPAPPLVFAATERGVWRSPDSCATWEAAGPVEWYVGSLAREAGMLYATDVAASEFYRSPNDGVTWTPVHPMMSGRRIRSFAVRGPTIVVGTEYEGMYLSTTGGVTWTATSVGGEIRDMLVAGSRAVVATNWRLGISSNGGTSWLISEPAGPQAPSAIASIVLLGDALFVSSLDTVYRTDDEGRTWTTTCAGCFGGPFVGIIVAHGSSLYAEAAPRVFHSPDSGVTWVNIAQGLPGVSWIRALLATEQDLLAGTRYGVFLRGWSDTAWTPIGLADRGVTALAEHDGALFAATRNFSTREWEIWKTTDRGANWSLLLARPGYLSSPRSFVSTGRALLAGVFGGDILRTTDGGASWSSVGDGLAEFDLVLRLGLSDSCVLAATEYSGVWRRPIAELVTAVPETAPRVPSGYVLRQNYPNPFNPTTTVAYRIPSAGHVTLRVFDLLGREVATLVNETRQQGSHEAQWNAHGLASGVYLYRLESEGYVETKKLVLVR